MCRWCSLLYSTLIKHEREFTREGIINFHNQHSWADDNLRSPISWRHRRTISSKCVSVPNKRHTNRFMFSSKGWQAHFVMTFYTVLFHSHCKLSHCRQQRACGSETMLIKPLYKIRDLCWCVCYIFGQLCLRISGFAWIKKQFASES